MAIGGLFYHVMYSIELMLTMSVFQICFYFNYLEAHILQCKSFVTHWFIVICMAVKSLNWQIIIIYEIE